MKQILSYLCCALLAACGGGGGGASPSVTDIQAKNLYYGVTAEFAITGNNLATLSSGITPVIPNCAGLTPAGQVLGQQVFSCTPTAVGDINVQVKDGAGAVIFSKTFTVPPPQVKLATSAGDIVVELNLTAAPASVRNFLNYVQFGFYTDNLFHRVIAGFVIQTGGFTSGLVAKQPLFAAIALESNNGLSNVRGTLAMARTSDPNSATSQFFFNLVDNPFLDYQDAANPGYAVFGKIVQGLTVMDAIGAMATNTVNGQTDVPLSEVLVTAATRLQ